MDQKTFTKLKIIELLQKFLKEQRFDFFLFKKNEKNRDLNKEKQKYFTNEINRFSLIRIENLH